MLHPNFEIHEVQVGDWVHLGLRGELDLASAPVLKDRLERLRADKRSVRLDLSQLQFIDSSGIHLLIAAASDARDGWQFEVDPNLPPQVERVLELVDARNLVLPADSRDLPAA